MTQPPPTTLKKLIAIRDHIELLVDEIATEISGQAMRAPSASIHDRLASLVALEDQLTTVMSLIEHFEARDDDARFPAAAGR